MKLAARAKIEGMREPRIVRLVTDLPLGQHDALLFEADSDLEAASIATQLMVAFGESSGADPNPGCQERVWLPRELHYVRPGDVLRINPSAQHVRVLYRRESLFNALLLTERCNSNCLMCSQPPQPDDDSYLVEDAVQAIRLMDPGTRELGFTGGEPTLLHNNLVRLVAEVHTCLPTTALHILSNGRLLAYSEYARRFAAVGHTDLMFGIPLYSDLASEHDFIVQAGGAFDQTIRGLMNLGRHGIRSEIRVVIHEQTYRRLPELAVFIARNLPFVEQVALMGLEMMGYVKMNLAALWVDPIDYQAELREAVSTLEWAGIRPLIYNHQLCVLDPALWPFARRSISDWKNVYMPECVGCQAQDRCGGFFASAGLRYSRGIKPFAGTGTDVSL